MSRQYDAKQSVLKAYPEDRVSGVDLFFDILDVSEDDFKYEEGVTAEEYIYGDIFRETVSEENNPSPGSNLSGVSDEMVAAYLSEVGNAWGPGAVRAGLEVVMSTYSSPLKIAGWINEDELPKNYPYDEMFRHSKVDGVRLFPVFVPGGK